MSAESEMSMVDPSPSQETLSTMSPAVTPAPEKDDKNNRLFVLLLVVALLLVFAIIGVNVFGGRRGSKGALADDSGDDDHPPSGAQYSYQTPTTTPPATTRRTRKRVTTLRSVTPSPSADNFVEPSTTLKWPKPHPGKQTDTLLCVVGTKEAALTLPDDGLCNLMFYVGLKYSDDAFLDHLSVPNWKVFQKMAAKSRKTEYGLSADFRYLKSFYNVSKTSSGKKKLKEYFDKKVVHHGVLNAEGNETDLIQSAEDVQGLGIISHFRKLHKAWGANNSHLVIGLRFDSYRNASHSNAKAAAINKIVSMLSPTIVVVHTHVNSWNPGQKPLCMSPWDYPNGRSDQPNMKDVITEVIPNASIHQNIIVMTSFTMSAQVLKTTSPYHSSKKNFTVSSFGEVNYAQVCLEIPMHKDFDAAAEVYIWSSDTDFSFCGETSDTMLRKVKKWLKSSHAPKKHGIALFDVELDDVGEHCKNGSFSRIKKLKNFLRS